MNRLTPENLNLYRALSGPTPNQDRTDVQIFEANSIEASQIGRPAVTQAIFVKGSRFNHSCIPNAYFTYHASRPAHMTINAMVPIQKSEEIFINYNAQTNFVTRAQRREALNHWMFDCDCLSCTENSVESDRRRLKMRTVEARIKRNQLTCENRQQLELTNRRHGEILREIRKDSYDLYDLCVAEGIIYPARAEALQWIANSYVEAAELEDCHPVYAIECYNNAAGVLRWKLDLDIVCNGYDSAEVKKTLIALGKLFDHVQEQGGVA